MDDTGGAPHDSRPGTDGEDRELPGYDAFADDDDETGVIKKVIIDELEAEQAPEGDFSLTKSSLDSGQVAPVVASEQEPPQEPGAAQDDDEPPPLPEMTQEGSADEPPPPPEQDDDEPPPLPEASHEESPPAPMAVEEEEPEALPSPVDPLPDGFASPVESLMLEPPQMGRQRLSKVDAFSEYAEQLSDLATERAAPHTSLSLFEVDDDEQYDSVVDDAGTHVWQFDEGEKQSADASQKPVIADRYRIEENLGVGGMATIYRVTHLHLDKEFAMKIIAPALSAKPVMQKNFFREAKVASQMEHPNIVAVTDFGVDETYGAYIVMEILKGETLRQRLAREQRLRLSAALDIGLQVAEALHYIHEQNIIHCDIKSENIFLSEAAGEQRRRTTVKLIDFGLSKTKALGAKLARSEVGGTPHYMSPEQFSGIAPQPSMDIYSLGVLLYEMVVGELPFDGELEQLVTAHLHQKPERPSKRLGEPLDERVDELIMKALAKTPADRQTSMGQVVYELRTLMDMLGFRKKRRARKVVDRAPLPAVDEGRSVFDNSPCPQFRIDSELRLVVANAACCRFLGMPPEQVLGKQLDTTKLCFVYPNLRMDVLGCLDSKTDLQQLIAIQKGEKSSHLLLWLVQELDETTGNVTFSGIIVPQASRAP